MILGGENGPYGSGLEHLYQCLRRLAVVSPETNVTKENPFVAASRDEAAPESHFGEDYAIVLTPAAPGSIPTIIWRSSYVIYF